MKARDPNADSGDGSWMVSCYYRLLVDVRELSGVPLGCPDSITHSWLLEIAPRLDKQILGILESNPSLENVSYPDTMPEWLMPLWDRFVLSQDGTYLKYLRDLLLFCYKAEYEPTHEQLEAAQAAFEETDHDVGVWDASGINNPDVPEPPLIRTARQIVGAVIYRIDWNEIAPHHGPGAVFPSSKPDKKSNFTSYYESIASHYPYWEWFWPSWSHVLCGFEYQSRFSESGQVQAKETIVANLVAVPKDSRGPRLICVHPKEAIWIQQGQRQLLERAIEQSPLTGGKVNFTDQTVNSRLALKSSCDRELTTLDLSEASDRISCKLVRSLFGDYAYEKLSCSRASHVKLLDGRLMELRKWAPMGNALCFPVESLVFYAMVRAGIRVKYGVNCTDIYVFGDDILFPSQYYEGAVYGLAMSGGKPNMNKTFRRGFFRESCGVDAYSGKDVTPFRMRKSNVSSTQDAVSMLDLAKRLRLRGYEYCASYIYSQIRNSVELALCDNPDCQGLVEYVKDFRTVLMYEPSLRLGGNTKGGYQQWQVRVLQVRSVLKQRSNDDWYHLLDSLINLARKESDISDRGTEYPIPYRTRLTYGWSNCLLSK